MKHIFLLASILWAFISYAEEPSTLTASTDSIPTTTDSIATTTDGMRLSPSPETLVPMSAEQLKIIELQNELFARECQLDSLTNLLNDTVRTLNSDMAARDARMEDYEKKIISLSSYLFFIPYYQVCIDDVAIPAFETLKDSPLYNKHSIRLTLLKNYRRDIEELIKYFNSYKLDKAERHVLDFDKWKAAAVAKFNNLDVVKTYKKFEYWNQTYLGNIIQQVNSVLNSGTAEKIDKTFAFYLSKLETNLKEGSK